MAQTAQTIFVAGMPRSGSTWQFNAVRLLLEETGQAHWAGWIGDLGQAPETAPLRLIKLHRPGPEMPKPTLVLTTFRPFVDCLASLVRMGWLPERRGPVRQAYHRQRALYHHWAKLSAYETVHSAICDDPEAEIAALDDRLARLRLWSGPLPQDRRLRVAERLGALVPPAEPAQENLSRAERQDPDTLLHPGHLRRSTDPDLAAQVAEWIADLP